MSFCGGVGVVGRGGLHNHFCVQPDYSFEVVLWLCCVVVGVVTIDADLEDETKTMC